MRIRPTIAVTSGEPAGIGPELVAMLAVRQRQNPFAARVVIIGDRALLAERAARIALEPVYCDYDRASFAPSAGVVEIWHQPLDAPVTPGRPDTANAHAVQRMLASACDACNDGDFAALVTAPVQKSVLADAGLAFSGHTEFFAERTGTPRVVMMLVGGGLRVALVTTHLPLAAVPAAITRDAVAQTIAIVDAELRATFGLRAPRIAVCGLNPHAGEGGHLGNEDHDIVAAAIEQSRADGIAVDGPLPADTVFVPAHARRYDAIVAMYHDQGLPVLKAASFGGGVNVTLGLPFVRTSVDHGTALDLAADAARAKTADPGSLYAAVELAIDLAQRATAAAVSSRD
jgi:4-hydroxythreonine-4-phosphate dehydrogenase